MAEAKLSGGGSAQRQIIIPRKGVLELQGLFESGDGIVELEFGKNHLRVRRNERRVHLEADRWPVSRTTKP